VEEDRAEAAKWYRQAAEQGFIDAQNILGYRYDLGDGVAQDPVEATKWFRLAAEQGDFDSQNQLRKRLALTE